MAVAPDSSGGVYITDYGNNRVLYFAAGSTTASRVYGQLGSYTCSQSNVGAGCTFGAITANGLYQPYNVTADSSGGVYIADAGNNRILYFASGSTTASRVYGQFGSYSTSLCNASTNCSLGIPSADTLYLSPSAVAVDALGGVYIADVGAHRVLYFPAGSTTASKVYGQFSSFSCATSRNGGSCTGSGPSANNLYSPVSVSVEPTGGIYITDANNHRVLYFASGSSTASQVYGQYGNFDCGSFNTASFCSSGAPVTAENLYSPSSGAADSSGGLYIVDYNNHRVLYFTPGS